MLDELWFSNPSTHLFHPVTRIRRHGDPRLLGVYSQRIDAANLKLRFAAFALRDLHKLIGELEHGEFIYFDDEHRLTGTYALEAFVIFLRAALDTSASAYATYFSGKTTLDSINDVLKSLPQWLPPRQHDQWERAKAAYDSNDYTWIHMLVGRDKGMSLRDLAVHRSALNLDTIIDERDRGLFVLGLGGKAIGPAAPWLDHAFAEAVALVRSMVADIQRAEAAVAEAGPTT